LPLPFRDTFDCVLVDAPCSGLGTLRRDPDIRWRRHEADLAELAVAQTEMLRHAAACVGAGGRLIYSTCSSEPEENDAIADGFLTQSPSFVAVAARDLYHLRRRLGAIRAALPRSAGTGPHQSIDGRREPDRL